MIIPIFITPYANHEDEIKIGPFEFIRAQSLKLDLPRKTMKFLNYQERDEAEKQYDFRCFE